MPIPVPPPDNRRQRGQAAQAAGQRAEKLAAFWLRLKGWRLLARNLRTPFGEIDILARRGSILAVVEVKNRPDEAAALNALRPAQQARLMRAGMWLQGRKTRLAALSLRFDVILIRPWRLPRHLPGAWRSED
jgi:putative endonuclease